MNRARIGNRMSRSARDAPRFAARRIASALALILGGFSGCAASTTVSGASDAPGGANGGMQGVGSGGAVASGSSDAGIPIGDGGGVLGTGGSASGSGGAPGGNAGAPGGDCLTLSAVAPATLDGLTAGSDARVRLRATLTTLAAVTAASASAPRWTWTVLRLPGIPVPVVPVGDPSTVEFSIAMAGRYTIQVIFEAGIRCALERPLLVNEPERNVLVFSVLPPDSFIGPIPAQRIRLPVKTASTAAISLDLKTGTPVRILPQDAGQSTVPSFVRVRALSGASSVDGYTDRGPVSTVLLPWPGETYEVLVVPDTLIAPQLFGTSDLLPGVDHLVLLPMNPGVTITGTATDASGSAVPDTRVILRAGTRPSTVGASDATGAFSVLTRPGLHSAVLSPPVGSGLPEVHVPIDPGISVSTADALTLSLVWARFTMVPVTLHLRASDNASDLVGAQVWLESQAELASVGTLQVNGGAAGASTLSASGAVRATAITDVGGVARFAAVPVGTYDLTIVPSLGTSATRTPLVVPPGGVSRTVPLDSPVALAGLLLPAGQTTGMRVLARDQGSGIAATTIFTSTVDAAGHYGLALPPGRTYQLEVDPQAVPGYARVVIGNVLLIGAQAQVVPDFVVPLGRAFNGIVTSGAATGARSGMGGAVVRVFCPSLSGTCAAPDRPIAEAVTRSDGTFRLVLPSALVD